MLHLTNGDSAADLLRETGLAGEVLPWRDVLHEGPVPDGLSPEQLAEVRVEFLRGHLTDDSETAAFFAQRNAAVAELGASDEVVLWFEHDLYDQLQLIEILTRFADCPPERRPGIDLVCIGEHDEVTPFHGLGQLVPRQLAELFPQRVAVSSESLELGRRAFAAFRSPEPTALSDLQSELHEPGAAAARILPFLGPALRRFCEEYPWVDDGLGRVERQVLNDLAVEGPSTGVELFRAALHSEEAPYLGDAVFFYYLDRLAEGVALIEPAADSPSAPPGDLVWQVTERGRDVVCGELDACSVRPPNRWLGGVRLDDDTRWRWSAGESRIVLC